MHDDIVYKSEDGYTGVLYDYHNDPYCGENYQLSIRDKDGYEVLHAYNASPKTLEELKDAVEHRGSFLIREMAKRYD